MSTLFVIQNQDNHYLSKKDDLWLDGSEPQYIFKTPHQDIALNTLIEMNSKQISVRAQLLEVEANNKNLPIVEISSIESKMPVKKKAVKTDEDSPANQEHDQTQSEENETRLAGAEQSS